MSCLQPRQEHRADAPSAPPRRRDPHLPHQQAQGGGGNWAKRIRRLPLGERLHPAPADHEILPSGCVRCRVEQLLRAPAGQARHDAERAVIPAAGPEDEQDAREAPSGGRGETPRRVPQSRRQVGTAAPNGSRDQGRRPRRPLRHLCRSSSRLTKLGPSPGAVFRNSVITWTGLHPSASRETFFLAGLAADHESCGAGVFTARCQAMLGSNSCANPWWISRRPVQGQEVATRLPKHEHRY